jgi:hypothetical protein
MYDALRNAYTNLVGKPHLEYTGVDYKKGNVEINLEEMWCDTHWFNLVQNGKEPTIRLRANTRHFISS